jgi:hypothetical protein
LLLLVLSCELVYLPWFLFAIFSSIQHYVLLEQSYAHFETICFLPFWGKILGRSLLLNMFTVYYTSTWSLWSVLQHSVIINIMLFYFHIATQWKHFLIIRSTTITSSTGALCYALAWALFSFNFFFLVNSYLLCNWILFYWISKYINKNRNELNYYI